MDPSHFDIIFGRYDDLRMGLDIVVPAAEFCASLGEDGLVTLCLPQGRLEACRPVDGILQIPDVAEAAPVVAGAVFTPTGNRHILPPAVTAAGIRYHHMVAPIGEQLYFGHR